ncbi:transporter [Aliisedimentitalea scapharcae]|uniref:Transporter n=1 Tax=Aliisedimentitalea scapharcae TaxID=1524259 RepID=A0ABZ2XV15_9RHOB
MAKELSNPVASLISVPFQFNYDSGYGPSGSGKRTFMNLQPVVPISLGDNWNLISRTIIPLIDQQDFVPGTSQNGIGDIVQSLFLSPKQPTKGGLIWGVGPAFLLPTGGNTLGADQFAAGITGVVLKQSGPWTYGGLANHLWDVGKGSGSTDISTTFVQPFLSYTTPDAWTFTLNSETTYDWIRKDTALPVNFVVTKLVNIGDQPVSIGAGVRYWADSTTNGPDGWGARLVLTFLFPK